MKTVFLRALEADDKAAALLAAIRDPEAARGKQRFEVDPASFASVPRSPFAYWVSERLRRLFKELPPFEGDGRTAKCGMGTLDDFRFLRLFWESRIEQHPTGQNQKWVSYVGPGHRSLAYSDVVLMVDWTDAGRELKCFVEGRVGSASRKIQSEGFYFRAGMTWPLRGKRFSSRAVPSGCVFSVAGKMAFVPFAELLHFLALFNSAAFDSLIGLFAGVVGGVQYEAGLIQSVPVPRLTDADREALARLAWRGWSLKRSLDTRTETSHAFTLPALLQVTGADLGARAGTWSEHVRTVEAEFVAIQAEIDDRCFALYGIDEADRRVITEGFGRASSDAIEEAAADTDSDAEREVDEAEDAAADAVSLTAELVSWAMGVAFGRFDVRLAMGDRPLPAEPEPFDPLPVCAPAMLTGDDGLPLSAAPAGYPLTLPVSGLLVDDPGHARDLTAAVRAVFEVVFGANADARWNEAAALLDPRDRNLRNWLSKGFFEYHLKRYSKSRRKAPILWQIATPSASYAIWLYAHRLTQDSLFQVQNDLVAQKLAHEERKHVGLVQAASPSPTASQRKEIEGQETIVEELRAMLDEVKRIAPLWQLDLNDGIVLTMAPFWRLVPHHKPWQKELKATWDTLCAGDYDWAHLAMHLWPERVVPKCATDRSLAIAHGIEDVFWEQSSATEKWTAKTVSSEDVAALIAERTSSAVKAALKSLLETPVPSGGTKRARKGKNYA